MCYRLDVCLQSVLDFTNELPGSKCFTSPKEGLTHMHNSHVLEKDSCYDPEMEDVMAMLTYLVSQLDMDRFLLMGSCLCYYCHFNHTG